MEPATHHSSKTDKASKLFIPIIVALISVMGIVVTALINKITLPFSVVTLDQQVASVSEVLDAMEVPAMLYSDQLKVVYANEKMANMYKVKRSDMVGKSPDMLNLSLKPNIENYNDFAAEQLDRIAKGHRGEPEGRAQVPMHLSADYLGRDSASDWYFISNPVYIDKKRFILTQLLEGAAPSHPCAPSQ